jgi:hypothetical protein
VKIEIIKEAIIESKKFTERAKAVLALTPKAKIGIVGHTKETAALRRASMDLTRMLAELRRSRI